MSVQKINPTYGVSKILFCLIVLAATVTEISTADPVPGSAQPNKVVPTDEPATITKIPGSVEAEKDQTKNTNVVQPETATSQSYAPKIWNACVNGYLSQMPKTSDKVEELSYTQIQARLTELDEVKQKMYKDMKKCPMPTRLAKCEYYKHCIKPLIHSEQISSCIYQVCFRLKTRIEAHMIKILTNQAVMKRNIEYNAKMYSIDLIKLKYQNRLLEPGEKNQSHICN